MQIDHRLAVLAGMTLLFGGCELFRQEQLPVPTDEEARAFYEGHRGVREVHVGGNVVEIEVVQSGEQLRRGGTIWARSGPYVHLLAPSTRDVFEQWPGVAAARVITYAPNGDEIARALLLRDALNGPLWRRSLNLLGHALQEGTKRPRRLEELAEWGEEHTRYEYDPEYVPNR